MRVSPWFLVITMVLAIPATAQTMAKTDSAACTAERVAIEQEMEIAQSKGQMLHRRQLAEQLATLQADCKSPSAEKGRAAEIKRLEQEVAALRLALDHAEEQLRQLKSKARERGWQP